MTAAAATTATTRSPAWRWWVCALLLLASALNYMDRQTLANAATRITQELGLSQEQYGDLEFGFGWAFAVGSLGFGVLADRFPVRWVYPGVLVLWSATGFATGLVRSYDGLLICRTLLGFFEAGHWPCAVKTTQRLLASHDRSMGNSLLQSGTSIGAIITPLIMRVMMTPEPGSWRWPFLAVGALGLLWIVAWFLMIRPDDLASVSPSGDTESTENSPRSTRRSRSRKPELISPGHPAMSGAAPGDPRPSLRGLRVLRGENPTAPADSTGNPSPGELWRLLVNRRMLVVLVVIALINSGWQTLRAWLPKFLQEGRGYTEPEALYFNSLFYIATDIGVLGAGALTLWLHRRGFAVTSGRLVAFGVCAVLAATAAAIPALPHGGWLLVLLLVVGAGALGVFPIYHAFSQDISPHHQGKVTGVAGIAAWALGPPAQKLFGRIVDRTHSFDAGFVLAGLLPLAAFLVLLLFWPRTTPQPPAASP